MCVQTEQEAVQLLQQLLEDQTSATANMVREGQRQSALDMGEYYYERGNVTAASKFFMRCREHCQSPHDLLMSQIAIIRAQAQMLNWPMVSVYVSKAQELLSHPKVGLVPPGTAAGLSAVAGIADMALGHQGLAAEHFAAVGPTISAELQDVATSTDVARYGALMSAAAHPRSWLRNKLLNNAHFVTHLESLPQVLPPS
jgi:COP9 signalosome complex subunit 1